MGETDFLKIQAYWQSREEAPGMIAERFLKLTHKLRNADPLISRWYHWVSEEGCVELSECPEELPMSIAEGVSRDDWGSAEPEGGYCLSVNNTPAELANERTLRLFSHAGSKIGSNDIFIFTKPGADPDPALVSYRVVRTLLLAIVDAFEPEFIYAKPTTLKDEDWRRFDRPAPMPPCWMIYIDPILAKLASTPASMIHERCPDGGLFMAATGETFDMRQPAHVAGAWAIASVLEPLNWTVPFNVSGQSARQIT